MAQSESQLIDRTALPSAQNHLAEEESRLQAEISAFEDFLDKLSENPPHPYRTDGGTRKTTIHSRSPTQSQKAVQAAYRQTVLAVEHWESEYGEETTLESMANEFGADIAAGLIGGAATWSTLLWNQLRSASEEAIETRQRTLQVLIAEQQQLKELQASLAEIGIELATIEQTNHPCIEQANRLANIQKHLEELADQQQSYLHQRESSNEDLFSSFVYSDLDTNYPGLAAIATTRDVCDTIELRYWAGLS